MCNMLLNGSSVVVRVVDTLQGGCSRRGVQWMGVSLYNETAYDIMQTTTPCFHCTPL